MKIQTVNYYVDLHKDDEANESGFRVIEVFQTWVKAFPKDDKRAPILTGLTRDEAETAARMFNRETGGDGFAAYAKKANCFFNGQRHESRHGRTCRLARAVDLLTNTGGRQSGLPPTFKRNSDHE